MANNPGVICYRSTDHTLLACIGAAGILVQLGLEPTVL